MCFLGRPEDGNRDQGVGNMALEIDGSHRGRSGQEKWAAKLNTPTSFKLVNRSKEKDLFSVSAEDKTFGLKLQEWP